MVKRIQVDSAYGRGLRVCMIVTNDMASDSRVARHAETLGKSGFMVTVVCALSGRTTAKEGRNGYEIVRVRSALVEYITRALRRREKPQEPTDNVRSEYRLLGRRKSVGWFIRLILRLFKISLLQLALLRTARRTRAHAYCSNDLDTLLIGLLAAGLERKVVYDSHELWPDMLILVPPFLKRLLYSYEGFLIRRVNAVMTVNEFIADVLARRYSVKSPIHVVYNCPPQGAQLRNAKKNKASKIALYHGGFSPERGLENLLKASQYFLPDIALLLRGSGVLEKQLKALASRLPNVRVEGPVEMQKVVEAARGADVGIIPYMATNLCNYYTSPNKLFEYIQAGLPIAASDLPFMRKVIRENTIGALFDARDPQSIAAAINRITRRDALAHFRRNVVHVANKYSWQVESKKLLKLYTEFCYAPK